MARLARVEVFAADEIAIVHVMNRTVRRCFLFGEDSVSGKNFDHRKVWIDQQLAHQARYFGIDLLCQAIMSNHFHLVLRSRPDVVKEWSDEGVARRWLMLCPERRDEKRQPLEPTEFERGTTGTQHFVDTGAPRGHSTLLTGRFGFVNFCRLFQSVCCWR